MYTCAHCKIKACNKPVSERENMPANCPLREPELYDAVIQEYQKEENKKFFVESMLLEKDGYGEWPRVREIVEFSHRMGYQKIGLAFCIGLKEEAEVCANIFRANGLEVVSVMCKNGGISKACFGIEGVSGKYDSICNPIGQARLLEKAGTDFNVTLGLCVGHDSLFFKYSHVMATALVAKDRVLMHNPVAALTPGGTRYLRKRLYRKKD